MHKFKYADYLEDKTNNFWLTKVKSESDKRILKQLWLKMFVISGVIIELNTRVCLYSLDLTIMIE